MKKLISCLLIIVMIFSIFALTGCKGRNGAGEEAKPAVSLVMSSDFAGQSLDDFLKDGDDKLKKDYGITVNTIECKDGNYKQSMIEAAKTSDVVVLIGWQFYEISEVAKDYPDTKFIWIDNPAEGIKNLPNVLCILYAQNEGSFLAGYIAAKMSESGVIGAVGGEDVNTVNDFITGYEQGAMYADPDAEVIVEYINSYENAFSAREAALNLNKKGADVIFQVAGDAGEGVFQAAEEKGFYVIGTDGDQKINCPQYDEQIICSIKKEVGNSIYDVVRGFLEEGKWEGARVWTADMASGYVSLAYGDENSVQQVSEELKAEAEEIAADIISGEIKVEAVRE